MNREKILCSLEEIKVISDPFRLNILFLFDGDATPMTVKQIAVKMDEGASKVHYHVKELERIGVLEIVETKEKAGIMEKFYLPTAETFRVEKSIGSQDDQSNHLQAGENMFEAMKSDFIKSNRLKSPGEKGTLNYGLYHLTMEETDQLEKLIREFLDEKNVREGTKPYLFGYALFRKYDSKEKVTDGNTDTDRG